MSFNWLSKFYQQMEKPGDYAKNKLAAYRLGIKAGGSIIGVRVVTAETCCKASQQLPVGKIYHPDDAPRLPLANCPKGRNCQCVYRPVMSYEEKEP